MKQEQPVLQMRLWGLPVLQMLRFVGVLKLWVSFAENHLFYRALLQKRPITWRSLLIVATPFVCICSRTCHYRSYMRVCVGWRRGNQQQLFSSEFWKFSSLLNFPQQITNSADFWEISQKRNFSKVCWIGEHVSKLKMFKSHSCQLT